MRVLEVTNTYPPGDISGVGALVFELKTALLAAGHEPTVLTRRAAPDDREAVAIGGPKLLFPLLAALHALRLHRARRFDLVHLHESDGALVALALRLFRLRPRLVATLQVSYTRERWAVRATRGAGRVLARPTAAERAFAWLRAPILAALGRMTARLADAVVAPSRGTARELEWDYRARVQQVIPNGVEAPEPLPARVPGAGRPTILYAGRLRTRKGVAVLLEAMARLRAEHPGALLLLAGAGEQRPALEAQAAALGLGEGVRFLGAVPRTRLLRLYSEADVFCLPSTYEGFPLAILEAMAYALPVVSTRVAGIPEAVEDGVSGYIVEPECVGELHRALGRLAADPALARRLGEAGRSRLLGEFDSGRVTRAYLETFAAAGARA